MRCPRCAGSMRVVDSREIVSAARLVQARKRKCCGCGLRINSREIYEYMLDIRQIASEKKLSTNRPLIGQPKADVQLISETPEDQQNAASKAI